MQRISPDGYVEVPATDWAVTIAALVIAAGLFALWIWQRRRK